MNDSEENKEKVTEGEDREERKKENVKEENG